jgi:hypothetical protein
MIQTLTRRNVGMLLAGLALPFAARPAAAEGLEAPKEAVILTVSGKIGVFNVGQTAQFDRPMIEALGMTSFKTKTPWYDNPVVFEGVRMDKLMTTVGAMGSTVTATALNDYTTELPVSDFARYGTLLALKRDGDYMPVRDKGPLWIVYPYDSDPTLGRPPFTSRSAWQVRQLVIK